MAAVLPHHPYLNASLEGERIILWEDVHQGMFGIESFTAIINPPETAILAVGQIVDAPACVDWPPCENPLAATRD